VANLFSGPTSLTLSFNSTRLVATTWAGPSGGLQLGSGRGQWPSCEAAYPSPPYAKIVYLVSRFGWAVPTNQCDDIFLGCQHFRPGVVGYFDELRRVDFLIFPIICAFLSSRSFWAIILVAGPEKNCKRNAEAMKMNPSVTRERISMLTSAA